jgi:putative ATPase
MDVFEQRRENFLKNQAPLADRMRPQTLDEFAGQDHIIGPGRLLRRAIQIDQLSSVIFYGPPGTGKTTLARIIANTTKSQFLSINAVLAGIADIRNAIEDAKKSLELFSRRTILFIDEVHRFNKAQQDALLPHVENGLLILIGATTENPYFEVNKALVSRSRIFSLHKLTDDDLIRVARQALENKERGYGKLNVQIDDDALRHLIQVANGDARGVLNALELSVETTAPDASGVIRIDRAIAEESIQQRAVLYDKDGDAHYDTISAFIKSLRGSDPDAALYWMARMVYAGEDPRFIFRRMLILACEDIGLADPNALNVVVAASQAFDYVGLPEGRYHLAHACLYCATAPKSNSSMAFFDALSAVGKEAEGDVPDHLKDASRDQEGFGHGEGYLYPHAYRDHWTAQQYLPETLMGRLFFQPSDQGYEKLIGDRVRKHREAQIESMAAYDAADPFSADKTLTRNDRKEAAAQWMKRTSGTNGALLDKVRDRLFDISGIHRDSLVLDVHGRTGLLTFQAVRTVINGGVWSLAHDEKEYDTITKMSHEYDALKKPQVLRTDWKSFDKDIEKAAGRGVLFDAIIGRNITFDKPGRADLVDRFVKLLRRKGVCALAETIASQGQRISPLLAFIAKQKHLKEQLITVEEELLTDESDPLTNWNETSLKKELSGIKNVELQIITGVEHMRRKIAPSEVSHWFRKTTGGERASLGERLSKTLAEKELKALELLLHAQLDNKEVSWKTSVAYVKITRELAPLTL